MPQHSTPPALVITHEWYEPAATLVLPALVAGVDDGAELVVAEPVGVGGGGDAADDGGVAVRSGVPVSSGVALAAAVGVAFVPVETGVTVELGVPVVTGVALDVPPHAASERAEATAATHRSCRNRRDTIRSLIG